MLTEIILIGFVSYLFYKWLNRKPDNFPPGEWGLPIIGHLPRKEQTITEFARTVQEKHGDLFFIKMGVRLTVFLTDYATIKATFARQEFSGRPDFFTFRSLRRFQNKGVIVSDGEVWHTNRKFAMKNLKDFGMGKSSLATIVEDELAYFMDELHKLEGKASKIDFSLNLAVLNTVMKISTGRRLDINDERQKKFASFVLRTFAENGDRLATFNLFPYLLKVLPQFVLDNYFGITEINDEMEDLVKYLESIVHDHQKVLDKNDPTDFVDMYLLEHEQQKGKPGSIYVDDNYFDLVSTLSDLYFAGSETSSSTIRSYCYYMATYPEIQKKVQKEIDSVVSRDRKPCLEDKENFPYFEATIHEVHRMLSLFSLGVPHATIEDTTLKGYNIPRGTVVVGCVELCHRSPKYWKYPDVFYPEHFLNDQGKFEIPKEGFLPFLVGRRACLGESIAKMELIIFLSNIFQSYSVSAPPGVTLFLKGNPKGHHNFNFPVSQELVFTRRS